MDDLNPSTEKTYLHHYTFPPYSVGETRPMRTPGRREIGHGALAERAIIPALPGKETFPYVLRVVSKVLSFQWFNLNGICLWKYTFVIRCYVVPLKAPVWYCYGINQEGKEFEYLLISQGIEIFLEIWISKLLELKRDNCITMDMKITGLPVSNF